MSSRITFEKVSPAACVTWDIVAVNSTGVGILASIYTSTKNQGGAVYVVSAPDRVESLLQTVQLWQFLNPCESVEAALQQAADG